MNNKTRVGNEEWRVEVEVGSCQLDFAMVDPHGHSLKGMLDCECE